MAKKKTIVKETAKECCPKEELVELLMTKIPGCFDDFPRRPLNRGRVEKLVEEILN